MKYPRVAVISLSDDSFFICVPLLGKKMRDFKRELSALFRERGENIEKGRKYGISFLTAFTAFSEGELEKVSNQVIRKIFKRREK